MEFKSEDERTRFNRDLITKDCPKIMAVFSCWEDHGIYCVGVENHRNTECAQFAPGLIDFNFYPSMHVCLAAKEQMHYIKLIMFDKSVYVRPLIKVESEVNPRLIPE